MPRAPLAALPRERAGIDPRASVTSGRLDPSGRPQMRRTFIVHTAALKRSGERSCGAGRYAKDGSRKVQRRVGMSPLTSDVRNGSPDKRLYVRQPASCTLHFVARTVLQCRH